MNKCLIEQNKIFRNISFVQQKLFLLLQEVTAGTLQNLLFLVCFVFSKVLLVSFVFTTPQPHGGLACIVGQLWHECYCWLAVARILLASQPASRRSLVAGPRCHEPGPRNTATTQRANPPTAPGQGKRCQPECKEKEGCSSV